MDPVPSFRDALIAAGHLIPMGVDGLYGTSGAFEDVLARVEQAISARGADEDAEILRFPPAIPQQDFERSDYLRAFPHFAGTVHCFCGNERDHVRMLECVAEKGDWTKDQKASGIVLTPAACYPAYPVIARRGPIAPGGITLNVFSYCFRHEPSLEPTRMQLFRMREYVRIGTPEQVVAFRSRWLEKGQAMMRSFGLPLEIELANDPFFGRAGAILADNQRSRELKFELLVPIALPDRLTACISFNYHTDHFGVMWDIRMADGSVAHTACIGIGMERITLGLFRHHGMDPRAWPADVRQALAMSA